MRSFTSNVAIVLMLVSATAGSALGSNCCVPAVPQQGVMGETIAQPHTLDIGLHYEYLRSDWMYEGREPVPDPDATGSVWKRTTLTLGYGLMSRVGLSAIVPYIWKEKVWSDPAEGGQRSSADGIGDVTLMARYSLLARSFVDFRELSVGLGVKIPTGSVEEKDGDIALPLMLQPGTGSWDWLASLSYYQGFDKIDLFASGSYLLTGSYEYELFTGRYESCEFGDQFSYLISTACHLSDRVDLSATLTGTIRGSDEIDDVEEDSSGRHEAWVVPSVTVVAIPDVLRLQAFWEQPVFHDLDGIGQLGSAYNLRFSATWSVPLAGSDE